MDEEEVRKEAKKILDNFVNELDKVEVKKKAVKLEVGGFRKESGVEGCDNYFREAMFENAPEKEGDFIVAESKKW